MEMTFNVGQDMDDGACSEWKWRSGGVREETVGFEWGSSVDEGLEEKLLFEAERWMHEWMFGEDEPWAVIPGKKGITAEPILAADSNRRCCPQTTAPGGSVRKGGKRWSSCSCSMMTNIYCSRVDACWWRNTRSLSNFSIVHPGGKGRQTWRCVMQATLGAGSCRSR